MIDIHKLGNLIAEEITNEPGVCFYPGGFKPPHKGHFEVAKDISSRNYITHLYVIISPKERDGITAEQSLKVWQTYLAAQPLPKVSVSISKTQTPVKDIYDYIADHPTEKPIYVMGGKDEVDDQGYFKSLQKAFGERVVPIPVEEKFGRISASYVRGLLRSGDIVGFEDTIPEAAKNKGYAEPIFKLLATTIKQPVIKEGEEPHEDEAMSIISKYIQWCKQMLEIEELPHIEFVYDTSFTAQNHSFGGYTPEDHSILISIANRNLADVLRTLGHELVHHRQNETVGINPEDGKTGTDVENEANAVAGMLMRTFGKQDPRIYNIFIPEVSTTLQEDTRSVARKLLTALHEMRLTVKNAAEVHGDLHHGYFKVGDIEYNYTILETGNPYDDGGTFYNVGFEEVDSSAPGAGLPTGNAGGRNYIKILSTMYKVVLNFTATVKPDYIAIAAYGDSNYFNIYNDLTKSNPVPGYSRKSLDLFFTSKSGQRGRAIVLKKNQDKAQLTESKEHYVPYMYSAQGFGCHVCKFYYKEKGTHMCSNPDYKAYKGTNELLDNEGNSIKDPSKWCSNWFKPKG
jgi:hypothetical protein